MAFFIEKSLLSYSANFFKNCFSRRHRGYAVIILYLIALSQ